MQSSVPIQIGAHRDPLPHTWPRRATFAVAASAFVAACAHLSVPLWFTPIPLSLANLAVLLVGLALGPVAAFSAMALYLIEGASGMPVFSPHGLGGVAQLLGPTGGFLLSYPLVAAMCGFVARKAESQVSPFLAALAGSVAATALLFLSGAGWLAHSYHVGWSAALHLAVVPFLPGEIVKIAAVSGMYSAVRRR